MDGPLRGNRDRQGILPFEEKENRKNHFFFRIITLHDIVVTLTVSD